MTKRASQRLMGGRVALVTGASRGIGAATAKLLGRHGAALGVNYHRSEQPARRVVEAIEADGGEAVALQADVRDEQQVAAMRDELRAAVGTVDTLVLNAVTGSEFSPTRCSTRTTRTPSGEPPTSCGCA